MASLKSSSKLGTKSGAARKPLLGQATDMLNSEPFSGTIPAPVLPRTAGKTSATKASRIRGSATAKTYEPSVFRANITQAIHQSGLSAQDISDSCGLDTELVTQLIAGQAAPSPVDLQKLCSVPAIAVSYKRMLTWCMLDDCLRYAAPSVVPVA